MLTLNPSQLTAFLAKAIPKGLPTLISGAPGIGKTEIWQQAAKQAGYGYVTSHPSMDDPTDNKGMPFVDKEGNAHFVPFNNVKKLLESKTPMVWGLEDLGQAVPSVQASLMPWMSARGVNGYKLPEHVTFIATTNRRTDKAGVTGLLEPVKSRFASIVELVPSLEDWVTWALEHDVCPETIAFPRFRPDLFHVHTPTADLTNSSNPRTWGSLSKLTKLGLSPDLELPVYAGAIGEAVASEYVAFLRIYRELPNPDSIIADPDKAAIPTQPSTMFALTSALAYRVTTKNFSAIYRYAERLEQALKQEFAVCLIKDCFKREKAIASTPTATKMLTSSLGKLILGKE